MTIQDKIKYIENKAGLGFGGSDYDGDFSSESVTKWLLKKDFINQNKYNKLITLTNSTNFLKNYYYKEPLNSESILFVNLVYNIIKDK